MGGQAIDKRGAKYFSMALVMTDFMEPGEDQSYCRERALERLVHAVESEERSRARCRDTDVAAAKRQRAW